MAGVFSATYQTGSKPVEVLYPGGTEPLKNFDTTGPVYREYDRTSKGFVFQVANSSSALLSKSMPLGLVQRLLVIQLKAVDKKPFSLELVVTDTKRQRLRLHFATTFRNVECNELHVQLPLKVEPFLRWNNLIVDLPEILARTTSGFKIVSLDSIRIKPYCAIRRIFTLPFITQLNEIPSSVEFLPGTDRSENEVYSPAAASLIAPVAPTPTPPKVVNKWQERRAKLGAAGLVIGQLAKEKSPPPPPSSRISSQSSSSAPKPRRAIPTYLPEGSILLDDTDSGALNLSQFSPTPTAANSVSSAMFISQSYANSPEISTEILSKMQSPLKASSSSALKLSSPSNEFSPKRETNREIYPNIQSPAKYDLHLSSPAISHNSPRHQANRIMTASNLRTPSPSKSIFNFSGSFRESVKESLSSPSKKLSRSPTGKSSVELYNTLKAKRSNEDYDCIISNNF
jgi:hypothetical protein